MKGRVTVRCSFRHSVVKTFNLHLELVLLVCGTKKKVMTTIVKPTFNEDRLTDEHNDSLSD